MVCYAFRVIVFFAGMIFSLFLGSPTYSNDFASCEPESEFLTVPGLKESSLDEGMTAAFCAEWNPDYKTRGHQCCGKISWRYRRRGIRCSPSRAKKSFCDEMTLEQEQYVQAFERGEIPDVLSRILDDQMATRKQAYCSPSNGFLAWGRPALPNEKNRFRMRRPGRCVNFGTDRMIAMLEWVGNAVDRKFPKERYPEVHLLVGDISAPRGGCLMGKGGRKGHASHMTGQDVDLGFLYLKRKRPSPREYWSRFEADPNWWLLKEIFNNPFACIEKVFLDYRHIWRLGRIARDDPDWSRFSPFIQHVRYHRNHFHIRIGDQAGPPGCGKQSIRRLAGDSFKKSIKKKKGKDQAKRSSP